MSDVDQPPPYLTTSAHAEVREVMARKANREVIFGTAWLVFGLSVSLFSLAYFQQAMIIAWGPAVYGIYKIIKGRLALQRLR
jgi:hypothetical protein